MFVDGSDVGRGKVEGKDMVGEAVVEEKVESMMKGVATMTDEVRSNTIRAWCCK